MRTQHVAMRARAAALLVMLAGCGDSGPVDPPPPVASVRVAPGERTLLVGQTVQLAAVPLAADGHELSGRALTWRSDNDAVAAVTAQGLVEARSVGAATIVATSEGKEGRATITVAVTPVSSVSLDAADLELVEYGTRQLVATPKDAQGNALGDRGVEWATENPGVATVSTTGVVTGVAAGTTRITATSEGKSAAVQVTVSLAPVASVQLDITTYALLEGAERRLVATAKDGQGNVLAGRTIQWTSSDQATASVAADGTVKAIRWGIATITARVGDKTASATIEVAVNYAYDLMYDSHTSPDNRPEIYRHDIRVPGRYAVRVLQQAGVWDVTTSPDGSKIAFTAADGSSSEIFVANRDGTNPVAVTSGSSGADQPAWSPDGTKIAFRRWPAGGDPGIFNKADIWVMNADGSGQVNLSDDADDTDGTLQFPTWSPRQPDGSYRIAYSRLSKPGEYVVGRIYSMRADGSDKRPVTAGGEYLEDEPAWSPDGQTIVFTRAGGTASGDLWLVNAAGGNERQLMAADPEGAQRAPAWSPDGQLIAFTSNHEIEGTMYAYQVYTVKANGTQVIRRTSGGVDKAHPAWLVR